MGTNAPKGPMDPTERDVRDLIARSLSPDERALIVLYHLHGFGADEIAEMTGRSHVAVRKQLERARKKLARAHEASEEP